MKTVLFACVHNAGRSQMAAAYFDAIADPREARAISAGTKPAERVHPEVVEVMREVGIDLSATRPRMLSPELAREADLLVTMGCGEECPFVPGLRRQDWTIEDPKALPLEAVRRIRDEIRTKVEALVESEDCRGSFRFRK
jgi:arsenate reductase